MTAGSDGGPSPSDTGAAFTSLHTLTTSYLGVEAHQCWADFLLWEHLLNLHPEVATIVELGTGIGGFALYLSHQAERRGVTFRTFDQSPPSIPLRDWRRLDLFANPSAVWFFLGGGPTVLHCDNGDKPRELAVFGSRLSEGSLCVVHDWGREAGMDDVPANLRPVHEDLVTTLGSLSYVLEAT